MIRDLSRLAAGQFDLLIVGGGIYGLAIAYDGAQRGLSVGLVERGDFGAATSFNHLKTIHGGLRYLQTADLGRMRESIRERRTFARIAPRFIAPLPFVMPASRSLTRSSLALRAALALDALVGSDRNRHLDPFHYLPAGRIISSVEACELLQGVAPAQMRAAALWYDYETVQPERLTIAVALAAASCGAALANYVRAVEPERDQSKRFAGARAKDALTGNEFDISAKLIVNASGPWGISVLTRTGVPGRWPLLKAMNLVTSRPAAKAALVAAARGGRALVLLPWLGRMVVGTSESTDERSPEDQHARRSEVSAFLAEINDAFPSLNLRPDEVTLVHRGIVPAVEHDGRLSLRGHSRIVDHSAYGVDGVISVIGVKYTTARAVAERTIDLVLKKLGRRNIRCRTAEVLLPTAGLEEKPPANPIRHAIEAEMAHTLADVVIRRTGIGAAGYPGDGAVAECAAAMQKLLGWSDEKTASEIAAVRKFYEIRD